MVYSVDRSEIVFFDLETTIPTRPDEGYAILEFGSILVCPKKLTELESFETLVRPWDLSLISAASVRANGITADAVISAPTFFDIADKVYSILHGRVWAGHNIERFDCVRLKEAYARINKQPPEAKGTIDSLPLLTDRFGRRAGDMKMASLMAYFRLGQQRHRSLGDVRMNLEVVKRCATVLFLESANTQEQIPNPVPVQYGSDSIPSNEAMVSESSSTTVPNDAFPQFIPCDKISMASITVSISPFFHGSPKIQIHHRDTPLQIRCHAMKIRFGLSTKFADQNGRPRLSFVVDANPSNLCDLLDACDNIAKRFVDSGSNSEWRPVVSRNPGFHGSPTIRLHLQTVAGDTTEIYHKDSSTLSSPQLVSGRYDVAELEALFRPGSFVDACFCLDPYNYQQNAGIRLVAKKLIL